MSDNFEQWFNSEFPDADLSQHETLKGYNNLKYGWNAALSSLHGEQAAKIAELEAKLAEVEKDAERYRYLRDCGHGFDLSVREEDEEGENWVTGYPPEDLDAAIDAYLDAAIQESKKGGAV